MAAIDSTQGTTILKAMLAIAALSSPYEATSPVRLALGSTAPTASANMTQLANGNGYTTYGLSASWNTVTAMSTTLSSALTWTCGAAGGWSIVGAELWDSAGTPLRWFFGTWNGQPISVAQNNAFQAASGSAGVTVSLS